MRPELLWLGSDRGKELLKQSQPEAPAWGRCRIAALFFLHQESSPSSGFLSPDSRQPGKVFLIERIETVQAVLFHHGDNIAVDKIDLPGFIEKQRLLHQRDIDDFQSGRGKNGP
jgi:hypothetical protein